MYGSYVILEMVLVLGLHWAARLRTLELDIAVGHSQVDVQILTSSDKLTTDVTGDHGGLVSVLKMSPEGGGSIEYLGAVTADSAGYPELQPLAVHLMDLVQVGQHLLTHGMLEHQEAAGLRTLVVVPL